MESDPIFVSNRLDLFRSKFRSGMKCYEQFSNFRKPQLPLGTHQSGSKVKDVKKTNAKVKEVQLRERKKSGEKYKIKARRQLVQLEDERSNTVHQKDW